jgi:hypothetical protein
MSALDLTLNDKLPCTSKLHAGIELGPKNETVLPITFYLMKDV